MKILVDQIGVTHNLERSPQRIISLVPSQTELLHDLGQEAKLVGVTKFCVHPPYFKSTKTSVGGTKKVNYRKIKSLQPDLIICNKEENTEEMVSRLKEICTVWVTDVVTISDSLQMITDFGVLLNCRSEAKKWTEKLHFALKNFQHEMANVAVRKVAYFIWKDPYMVAGSGTFINSMLALNKFENCYGSQERYPEVAIDMIEKDGDPELILLSSEPYPFKKEDGYVLSNYTKKAQILLVDGEMFSWHGSRLIKALAYFKMLQTNIGK